MSVNVVVEGVPSGIKFNKLVFSFKGLLKRIHVRKFWIREISDMYDGNKQMMVEFPNHADALKACNHLDNFPFVLDQAEYPLSAFIDEERGMVEEYPQESDWGRRQRPRKRDSQRSRSPDYSSQASKLDMEIELLRKQRQVIEEERRLLVEQKKLEMIREFGPSAEMDFESEHFEAPRKRPKQTPMQGELKKSRKHSPPPTIPRVPKGLPAFFQPCKRLIAEMMPHIDKDAAPGEKKILIKLIRAAIRKNLSIALDGKDYMPTFQILKLYRELHPTSTDEAFVAKILCNIRASYLPEMQAGKPSGQTVNKPKANGAADGAKEANDDTKPNVKSEGDSVAQNKSEEEVKNETGTQESTNGENKDTESNDVSDEVKANLSQNEENIPKEISEDNAAVLDGTDAAETTETPVASEAAEEQ